VRRHLRHIERFLELLCLAVHIAGGQPARGPELLSVRWRNGVLQDRNLYVIDGQVALVTRYHKTQSQWDKPKVIVRFLTKEIGQLTTAYLLYVRPLRALLQSALEKPVSASVTDYLWADEGGPWETDRLTRTITLESAKRLGTRLTVQEYRHTPAFAKGIDRACTAQGFVDWGEVDMAVITQQMRSYSKGHRWHCRKRSDLDGTMSALCVLSSVRVQKTLWMKELSSQQG
jgi:hypothetical protein